VKKHIQHIFWLEPLEPRLLLSGDAAELLVPGAGEIPAQATQEQVSEQARDPDQTSAPELEEDLSLQGDALYPVLPGNESDIHSSQTVFEPVGEELAPEQSSLEVAADPTVQSTSGDTITSGDEINILDSLQLVEDPMVTKTFGANTFLLDTTNGGMNPLGADILITGDLLGTGVDGGGFLYLNAGTTGNIVIQGNIGTSAPVEGIIILNANNVTLEGNVQLDSFTQQAGEGDTTFGDSAADTLQIGTGDVNIITENNITFTGNVTVTEGDILLTSNTSSVGSAQVTFSESVTLSDGDLIINSAKRGEFTKTVNLNGALRQVVGTERTAFRQDVDANTIEIFADQEIRFEAEVRLAVGDMTLVSNDVNFVGGPDSIIGADDLSGNPTSDLFIRPVDETVSVDLGSPTGGSAVFEFTTSDIAAIEDGFNSITFGYINGSTNNVLVGNALFTDPLNVHGGRIRINGSFSAVSSLLLEAESNGIEIDGTQVQVSNEQINSIWQSSQMTLLARNGDIDLVNGGSLTIANNDDSDPAEGSEIFLTAENGAIRNATGSNGLVSSRDLMATAFTDIVLLTQIENLTAESTDTGLIRVDELDALHVISSITANGPQTFSSGGDTELDLVQSTTDAEANTVDIEVFNGNLTLGRVLAGTLGDVTLTVEGYVFGVSPQALAHIVGDVLTLSAFNGVGQSSVPLLIQVNSMDISNSTSGEVVLRQLSGRSAVSVVIDQNATGSSDYVSLLVLGGNTTVNAAGIDSESSAGVLVDVEGDLTLNGGIRGEGGLMTVDTAGAMIMAAGVRVSSGGGDVVVEVIGDLSMAVDAEVVSSGGNIRINSGGNVILGSVDARNSITPAVQSSWGHAAILATGSILDTTSSSAMNIQANALKLLAGTGIGSADGVSEDGLEIDVILLTARTSTGDIVLKDSNALTTGTVSGFTPNILQEDGSTTTGIATGDQDAVINLGPGDVLLSAVGVLTLQNSTETNAVENNGVGTVALIGSQILVQGAVRSQGGNLSFDGSAGISMTATAHWVTSGTGNIAATSSGGSLLADAAQMIQTGSGTILLSVLNSIELGTVSTTGAIGLRATNGSILGASGGTATRTVVTGDSIAVIAGDGVNGPADSVEPFRMNVNTFSLQGGSGASFQFWNDGDMTIDSSSAAVSVYNAVLTASALLINQQSNATLSGNGDLSIVFSGGSGFLADTRVISTNGAGSITLDADVSFTMGTSSLIQNVNGPIDISAQVNVGVASVMSTDGDITVTASTGSIFDTDPAELPVDFSTQGILDLSASTGIGIVAGDRQTLDVLLGTLTAETATGGIFVRSTDSFRTEGVVSTAGSTPISLESDSVLTIGPGTATVAISGTGDVVLVAGGNLTQETGGIISSLQDIRLSSGATMSLVEVSTPEDVSLEAPVVERLVSGMTTEISADGVYLVDVGSLGSVAVPLRTAISRLAGTVSAGTLAFTNTGDLALGLVTVDTTPLTPMGALPLLPLSQSGDRLNVSGAGEGVFVYNDGSLTAEAGLGSVFTTDSTQDVLWETTGTQDWGDAFTLGGGDLTLRSGMDLDFSAGGVSSTGGGDVFLEVTGNASISPVASLQLVDASLLASVGGDFLINGAISTTGSVALLVGNAIRITAIGGPIRVTAADLILNAGYAVGTGLLPLTTQVSRLSGRAAAGGIFVDNTGNLEITNLGFSVPSLQLDASREVAFSGHVGGIVTTQAGAIGVNSTGTMTVQEIAAVIEAFSGSFNAISIVADNTGPDGNDLDINFDVIRSGTEGDPPVAVYEALDGRLTISVREGVSTLQEIVDEINANLDFPATAVLAGGLEDGSQVFTLAASEDTAFFAEGGRLEGVIATVSSTFSGGAEPISAIAQILLPGESFNIKFTAVNPGDAANAFQVRLLDDGPGGQLTDASDEAVVVWDSGNGLLNIFINYGYTTLGTILSAVDSANMNDSVPFTAELDGFSVPSDLNTVLGESPVTLISNLSASAELRPVGGNNDMEITAVGAGPLFNGVSFLFVDDGSVGSLGVRAELDTITNLMTIYVESAVTTANEVIAAVIAQGTFTASLITDSISGANDGSGVIQAQRFITHSGAIAVNSFSVLGMEGDENDLILTADVPGVGPNGLIIEVTPDDMAPVGSATASYDSVENILYLNLNSSFVSAGNLIAVINSLSNFDYTPTLAPDNSGFGTILLAEFPLTDGGTGGPPRVEFIAEGLNNDFELIAISGSPLYENIQAFIIDDGSITDGSATAQYLETPRHLILNVQSGVTTLNTLLGVLNADITIPVTGAVLSGNDGTGVFNIPAVGFSGGVDPIAALAPTPLPSGNELILEAVNGGVAENGVQVVYALESGLSPNTAEVSFFEVDGIRLLQISVQSSTTTFAAIQSALTNSGLPYVVSNLGAGTQTVGFVAPRTLSVQEGNVRLSSEGDVSLLGRVQSETGGVTIRTDVDGNLSFDSTTARVYAISEVDIDLQGSFANLSSTESPLVKVFADGLLRISTGTQDLASLEPVLLRSGGDVTIEGAGGLALTNVNLDVFGEGTLTLAAPVDAGTGNIVFDAGDGILITVDGSAMGTDLRFLAENDITQNGNLTAMGAGFVDVDSNSAAIRMGADSETRSDSGPITYDAPGDIDITAILSTSGTIDVSSGARIRDTHASNGLNLSTSGDSTLTAQTGIGAIQSGDLKTNLGNLQLRNLGASGDIVLTETGTGADLTITELTQDALGGWSIVTVESGNLTLGPVAHSSNGNLLISVIGAVFATDTISLQGGIITIGSTGNAEFDKDVSSNGGDVSVFSGAVIDMDPLMTLDANGGVVSLRATGNVLLSAILTAAGNVRIESTAASILRAAADGRTNVIAVGLQLKAAQNIASLAAEANALITQVTRMTASALNGVLAIHELDALEVGTTVVTVTLAQPDRMTATLMTTETQLRTESGNGVLDVAGDFVLETLPSDPTMDVDGNFLLDVDGSVTFDGDALVTTGSFQLRSSVNIAVNGAVSVDDDTLLITATGTFTQAAASVITVGNADAILASGGNLILSRIDTGSGDLALTSGGSITRDASAPAIQISSNGLRLQAATGIASDTEVLVFTATSLSALSADSMFLEESDALTVDSVEVIAKTVSLLGDSTGTARTETALADLQTTVNGGIYLNVGDGLVLNDGDNDSWSIQAAGTGHVVLNANNAIVNSGIQAVDGHISVNVTVDLHVVTVPPSGPGLTDGINVLVETSNGDIHIVSGNDIRVDDASILRSVNGNARLQAAGDVYIGSLQTPNGLSAFDVVGSILDNGETDTDVIASTLQMISGAGIGVLSPYNALDVDAGRMAVRVLSGPLAIAEINAADVGEVQGSVSVVSLAGVVSSTTVTPIYGIDSQGNGSVSLSAVGDLTFLTDGDPSDSSHALRATGAGNVLISSSSGILSIQDSVLAGTGHVTLQGATGIALGDNVTVDTAGTGTLTLLSSSGTITQNAGGTLTTLNGDIVLQANGSISVAGIVTSADVAISSTAGSILDNEAARDNVSANGLRLAAGLDIATGLNPLETVVTTLTASTVNGAMFMSELNDVDVGPVDALTQVVALDATVTPTAVATQTGLRSGGVAGTIVLVSRTGGIHVLAANEVEASQAGNVLLSAVSDLELDADVTSGTGSMTLESQANIIVDLSILIQTAGAGEVHLLSAALVNMGLNSRIVAGTGNVAVAAVGTVNLGGISTSGRASVASQTGSIFGVGSTDFDQEVIASQLALAAPFGGVGTLLPVMPVQVFRTRVSRIAATVAAGGINIRNEISMSVDQVSISLQRVTASGSLLALPTVVLQDVVTTLNGSVVLDATGGTITLNDGDMDGNALVANGSGNIRVSASQDISVNADVLSTTGHITLRAGGSMNVGDHVDIVTDTPGTIYLRAETGSITMSASSTASAPNSTILIQGSTDVTAGSISAAAAAIISVNGNVFNADNSITNFSGTALRIVSNAAIGSALVPFTTGSSILSLESGAGIFVREVGDVQIGSTALLVQEVLVDNSLSPITQGPLAGLTTTANNGPVIIESTSGAITVVSPVEAHGSGNILIKAATQVVLQANVLSASGNISLVAGSGLSLASGFSVSTGGTGSIYVDAGTGTMDMAADSSLSAPGGSIRVAAGSTISLGVLSGANLSLISGGDVVRATGSAVNLTSTGGLRIEAVGTIGTLLDPLQTAVVSLSAHAMNGGIFILESDDINITGVSVVTALVGTDAQPTLVTDLEQSDLEAGLNQNILLSSSLGSISLNDGGDGDLLAVEAQGSGWVRLQAAVNLLVNGGVVSGTGNLTLIADADVTFGVGVVTVQTAAPGDISIRSTGGAVTQTGLSQVIANSSILRIFALGNVVLGNLQATDVSVISSTGSILNAIGSTQNIIAANVRLDAAATIGVASRRITMNADLLSAHTNTGGIYISEINSITVGSVSVTVEEMTATGTTTTITDTTQVGVDTLGVGDVVLVTQSDLTVGLINGLNVNLISGGRIVDTDSAPIAVSASTLLLQAEGDIGSSTQLLRISTDTLAGSSTMGSMYLSELNDVTVGTVSDLTTVPAGSVSNLTVASDQMLVFLAGGQMTLGRITGGTVALDADSIRTASAGSLNVSATNLRVQALNGVGTDAAYLRVRVSTLSGLSSNGDLLIIEEDGVSVGSVTVVATGLTPETLSGLTTTTSGDVVLISSGILNAQQPVNSVENVRLSSTGLMTLSGVSGVDVSLISGAGISQNSGEVAATMLRINAEGDLGSAGNPLLTNVEQITALTVTGSMWITESDDVFLAAVAVSAGGVTDAAQHGLSAAGTISFTSSSGRILDGGNTALDVRGATSVSLIAASGMGTTGSGALDLEGGTYSGQITGNGTVYLDFAGDSTLSGFSFAGEGYLYIDAAGNLTVDGAILLGNNSAAILNVIGTFDLQADMTAGRDIRILSAAFTQATATSITSARGNILIRSASTLTMAAGAQITATLGMARLMSIGDMTVALVNGGTAVDLLSQADILGASTTRAEHEISGGAARIKADGAVLPILTQVERLDVDAGAVSEIYEFDDLIVGRYGLRLINESAGDELTLRMNEAELSSYDGVAVIPGVGTFVWVSDENVTLGTRLESSDGDVRVEVNGIQQSGALTGSYIDAVNGRVTVTVQQDAGTVGSAPVTVRAAEFTSSSQSGQQAFAFSETVRIVDTGVTTASGSAATQLDVLTGNLIQAGRITHSGNGTLTVNVGSGALNVEAAGITGSAPLLSTGGVLSLNLDLGMTLTGVTRYSIRGSELNAVSRTGSMSLNISDNDTTQAQIQNIRINEGTGFLDVFTSGSLVVLGTTANFGTGGLSIRAGEFISMSTLGLVRNNGGALTLEAKELELARVESFGASTLLRATIFGIKRKPGFLGTNIAGDHVIRMELPATRAIDNISVSTAVQAFYVFTNTLANTFNAGDLINFILP